jgi:hypothetical protein
MGLPRTEEKILAGLVVGVGGVSIFAVGLFNGNVGEGTWWVTVARVTETKLACVGSTGETRGIGDGENPRSGWQPVERNNEKSNRIFRRYFKILVIRLDFS